MAVHPHAVAEPVSEVGPVSAVGDDLPRRPVELLALRDERFSRFDRGRLRIVYEIVHLLELRRRRIAEPDRARDVRRIAFDPRSGIDQHDSLAGQLPR